MAKKTIHFETFCQSRIAEIELGMENTIGITLETGVGVQSAILHVNR